MAGFNSAGHDIASSRNAGSNLVSNNIGGTGNAFSNSTRFNNLRNMLSIDGVFNFRNFVVSDRLMRFVVFLNDNFFSALGILQHVLVLVVLEFQIIDSLVEDSNFLFVVIIIGMVNGSSIFLRAVSSNLQLLVVDDFSLLIQLSI